MVHASVNAVELVEARIMGYRRYNPAQKEAAKAWAAWQAEQAALIERTGLPSICFERENWDLFIDHGYLEEGNAHLKDLSLDQKAALLRLIMTWPQFLNSSVGHDLIIDLIDAVDRMSQEGTR